MSQTSLSSTTIPRRLLAQIAIVAIALACLAWRAWPDGKLRVIFFETKGDAALIQIPGGTYVLIDGGSDPAALAAALGRNMPFWRRSLDAVVLTSPDQWHLPGQVAALERYNAGLAVAPALGKHGALVDEWRRLLGQQQTPIQAARPGTRLRFGNTELQVLSTADDDQSGMVLQLNYGATAAIFDHSGGPAEETLDTDRAVRKVDLLVFPWERDPHTPIVAALHPRAFVLTDGQQADRPVEQTFTERSIDGARLYHERLDGTITWISDGTRAWVETERPREQP